LFDVLRYSHKGTPQMVGCRGPDYPLGRLLTHLQGKRGLPKGPNRFYILRFHSSGRVVEWQTRWLQVPVRASVWGFKSPLAHGFAMDVGRHARCLFHRRRLRRSSAVFKSPLAHGSANPAAGVFLAHSLVD
jgi:hypothetical protein